MENLLSDQLNIGLTIEAFRDVIHNYFYFLRLICCRIVNNHTDDLNRETRKFNAIEKELSNFLLKHKKFFKLKKISLMSKDEAIVSFDLTDVENDLNMLKQEHVAKLNEKAKMDLPEMSLYFQGYKVHKEIVETIKYKLGKSHITNEDIPQFLKDHFLVDKVNLGTKCSNYKELEKSINN